MFNWPLNDTVGMKFVAFRNTVSRFFQFRVAACKNCKVEGKAGVSECSNQKAVNERRTRTRAVRDNLEIRSSGVKRYYGKHNVRRCTINSAHRRAIDR